MSIIMTDIDCNGDVVDELRNGLGLEVASYATPAVPVFFIHGEMKTSLSLVTPRVYSRRQELVRDIWKARHVWHI